MSLSLGRPCRRPSTTGFRTAAKLFVSDAQWAISAIRSASAILSTWWTSAGGAAGVSGRHQLWMVDGNGIPLSAVTLAADHAEVDTLDTLVDGRVCDRLPDYILYDTAADADWVRNRLIDRGAELVCPHRKNRTKPVIQDGRRLRRYKRRWIVEGSIAWLQNSRRLLVRHDYHAHLFDGFVQIACLLIILRRF